VVGAREAGVSEFALGVVRRLNYACSGTG
jgi:hypothetical protein